MTKTSGPSSPPGSASGTAPSPGASLTVDENDELDLVYLMSSVREFKKQCEATGVIVTLNYLGKEEGFRVLVHRGSRMGTRAFVTQTFDEKALLKACALAL